MFSDIDLSRLIFRKTPESWHPYLTLARIDRPVGIWLLLLPGLWSLALAGGSLRLAVLFAFGALFMRAAGCIVNDLWDRDLDAQVERTHSRPLASGRVSPRHALRLLAALLGLSFLILISLPITAIGLGIFSLLLVAAYPVMKRLTWWPQLFLGFTFNWGALLGWAAATDSLAAPALWLYAGGIFWTLAYDTIYAHQDKEDDALVGIKSTARLFGARSKIYVGAFFALSLLFLALARWSAGGMGPAAALALALAAAQAIWQVGTWRMDDPQSCLNRFKSNTFYGLLVLLANLL